MMRMVVEVYLYTPTITSFSAHVGGYNYIDGSRWINTFAQIVGSTASNNRVRFGHNGTNCVIVIGDTAGDGTASDWAYPKVVVKDFQAGHANYAITDWQDGWDISIVSDLAGYTFPGSGNDYSDTLLDANSTKYVDGTLAGTVEDNAAAALDKTETYYQTEAPTGINVGDLWYDTDNNNKAFSWSGTAWVVVQGVQIAASAQIPLKLYYQTPQASTPTALTTGAGVYNFSTKTLSTVPAGWGLSPPTSGTGKVWSTTTTYRALSTDDTVDDGTNTFTTAVSAYALNATAGAQAGVDLRDESSNTVGDSDVLNAYAHHSSNLTVTVGPTGDYNTLSDALDAVTNKFITWAASSNQITIQCQSTFVMNEKISVDGINLSWITIDFNGCEFSATPTVNTYGIILASYGGVSPVLAGGITLKGTSGGFHSFARTYAQGSTIICDTNLDITDSTNLFTGFHAQTGGIIYAQSTSSDGLETVAEASDGGTIHLANSSHTDVQGRGLEATKSSKISASNISLTGKTSHGSQAVYATGGSEISCPISDFNYFGASLGVVYAVSSTVRCDSATITNRGAASFDVYIGSGAIVSATGGTYDTNKTVNAISSSGVIFN
jgi:hypothetical protein